MNYSPNSITALLVLTALLASCSVKPDDRKVVARVNNAPIFLADLRSEVAGVANQYPGAKITCQSMENQLNTMIERKLMIQEAARKGLSDDERFMRTIKTFYEQTLMRELIEVKNREWKDTLFVTEDDVQQEYRRMRYRPVMKTARACAKAIAEEFRRKMLKGERIESAETVGPLLYDDVRHSPLVRAFDLAPGEAGVFEHDGEYIAVMIVKRVPTSPPPLAQLRDRIKEAILDRKREEALAEWVESMKQSSMISINKGLITETGHE